MARRLVLAHGGGGASSARSRGLRTLADRPGRSVASAVDGDHAGHAHRRHRQPVPAGGHRRCGARRPLIRWLADLGCSRDDRPTRVVHRLSRRVRASTRTAADGLQQPAVPSAAAGGAGERRRRPARARRRRVRNTGSRATGPGAIEDDAPADRRVDQAGHADRRPERIAKKTYIRAPRYPQAAFDAALAGCKGDPAWRTFELPRTEAGHDAMVDAPARIAEILQQVA